jgi:hypothetical protein
MDFVGFGGFAVFVCASVEATAGAVRGWVDCMDRGSFTVFAYADDTAGVACRLLGLDCFAGPPVEAMVAVRLGWRERTEWEGCDLSTRWVRYWANAA